MKTIYKYGLLNQGKYSVNCVVRRVLKNKQNKMYSYSLHTNIYVYGLSLRANPGGRVLNQESSPGRYLTELNFKICSNRFFCYFFKVLKQCKVVPK